MENNNSFPYFPFQEDENIPISCPDFTIWDNQISYPTGSPQQVQSIDFSLFRDDEKAKQPKNTQETNNQDDHVQKKIMHRDIERQRRQAMATLYSSLRSVLPAQFLKGKRSVSDQIHEATKYIRCLQKNVKDLGMKRDNVKILSKSELQESDKKGISSKISPFCVRVEPCSVGVEVLISGDFMGEGPTLPVSRILQVLLKEGLVVVCCNWTKSNGRSHYVIQSECTHQLSGC
ncbi:hypothetical protein CASFOL_008378 [Castilleja foliolosa]|uniref:BHLH domain-containing protein n=1 Tax=Castilleja foliolosa TaxID=1961234 RepID=A0ABD3E2S9_9LAMI